MQTKSSLPNIYAPSACFNTSFHPACLPLKQGTYDSISKHVLMGFSSQPNSKLHRSDGKVINTYFISLNFMVTREKIMRHNPFTNLYEIFCHTGKSHQESTEKGVHHQNPQNSCSHTSQYNRRLNSPTNQEKKKRRVF